jgi:hypothetical protein
MDRQEQLARHRSPGEVHPEVLYRVDEIKARMGWRDSSLRAARRRGLVVRRDGKRAYVLGEDVIAYIKRNDSRTDDLETGGMTCAGR